MTDLKVSPNHLESEKALLGSMLINPDVFYDVVDTLGDNSFYYPKHNIIYKAISDLSKHGEPIDLVTLSKKLESMKELTTIGGREYLIDLTTSVPTATNALQYAANVKEFETRRSLISAGQKIESIGYDKDSGTLEEIIDQSEKILYESTFDKSDARYHKISESLSTACELLDGEKLQSMRGISTGFESIDEKIAGFQPSDLIILAARPSVGKTTLALDMARKIAIKSKVPVGIFSLEMSSTQLSERMLAAEAQTDAWKLRTKGIKGGNVVDALGRLNDSPIFIDDRAGTNILSIRSNARRLRRRHNVGLIVVDYLQLVSAYNFRNSDSMVHQITEISRTLKQIARELKIPVLALSQLSREVEKREGMPRLSDLRDSGSIEQDADLVLFLHRDKRSFEKSLEEKTSTYFVDLLIEKHRNGPTGRLRLLFDRKSVSFNDIDKHHSNEQG